MYQNDFEGGWGGFFFHNCVKHIAGGDKLRGIYFKFSTDKMHHPEALGNKYKDLYEFIPQSFEIMSFL